MKNRFLNNKTFTPFTHGARGETILSQFILYPLRATSATRGTLGAIASLKLKGGFMKLVPYIFLLIVLSFNCLFSQTQGGVKAKLKYSAKMKEKPDYNSNTLDEIESDEVFILLDETDDGFYLVKYNNQTGYIKNDFVIPTTDVITYLKKLKKERKKSKDNLKAYLSELQIKTESNPAWICSLSVSIKSDSNINSQTVHTLKQGKKLYIQNQSNEWSFVKWDNYSYTHKRLNDLQTFELSYFSGWVQNSFLSINEITSISDSDYRRTLYIQNNPGLDEKYKNAISRGSIILGMNKEMVLASWGEPDKINRTVTVNMVHAQWVYGERYIYFDNDVLTAWQD